MDVNVELLSTANVREEWREQWQKVDKPSLLPLVPPAARRMFEEMVQETVEGNSLEMELRQDQVEGWVMNSCIVHNEHYFEENE